ncbi:hypothetical protein [Leptospira alexanderi]|uniref:hypothetical protein n=1 Tax=Leptospira alexanderi TaxID=100053 RepID=UPI000990A5F6|nr:hypothetical protein [Leptospira alexanderi]
MNQDNFEDIVLEIKKLAKKYTRSKSKRQFDEQWFEYYFLQYVKEKEIDSNTLLQVASHFMENNNNFDKDTAIFIIGTHDISDKMVSNFLQKYLPVMNKEQTDSTISLINHRHLDSVYYSLLNHLNLNSFYNSEIFRQKLTYLGISFDKKEGYKEFEEALERDILTTDSKQLKIESYTGGVLSSLLADKDYEKIQKIFQRFVSLRSKNVLMQQLSLSIERWGIDQEGMDILKRTIGYDPEPRKN